MQIGEVAELVHEQTYLGQQVNNVYFFQAGAGTDTLTDLATWFETIVVPVIKQFQNDLVSHVNLRLRNLMDTGETYEEPLTGTGAGTSGLVELPSFIAGQIRLDHATAGVRPGFKRYVGLTEGHIEDGLLTAANLTQLDNIATQLINPLPSGPGNWSHVILNRVCETPNPDPDAVPKCFKYRLPETVLEVNPGYPVTFESYVQPTSQNSRKWYT
jgi:hypothetical protein